MRTPSMRTCSMRTRRGVSIVEMVTASGMSLLLMLMVCPLVRFSDRTWAQSGAEGSAKEVLHRAVQRMSPSIRSARRVAAAASGANVLTLVMPRVDAVAGEYVLPLEDGDTVCFYLSDSSGSRSAAGTVLWRSVNGVPDAAWSMRGSHAAMDLGGSGLLFTYFPSASNPSGVGISLTTTQWMGDTTISRTEPTQVFLRNSGF